MEVIVSATAGGVASVLGFAVRGILRRVKPDWETRFNQLVGNWDQSEETKKSSTAPVRPEPRQEETRQASDQWRHD